MPSVFDLSSDSPKKKPSKSSSFSPKPPAKEKIEDNTAQEMLKKMNQMHKELVKKMDNAYEKAGVEPAVLDAFSKDPSNFSQSGWQSFQQKKDELELKISGLSGDVLKEKKQRALDSKASKTRKSKTLGSRRNWLDMH